VDLGQSWQVNQSKQLRLLQKKLYAFVDSGVVCLYLIQSAYFQYILDLAPNSIRVAKGAKICKKGCSALSQLKIRVGKSVQIGEGV
jgi:hypothetical protein